MTFWALLYAALLNFYLGSEEGLEGRYGFAAINFIAGIMVAGAIVFNI